METADGDIAAAQLQKFIQGRRDRLGREEHAGALESRLFHDQKLPLDDLPRGDKKQDPAVRLLIRPDVDIIDDDLFPRIGCVPARLQVHDRHDLPRVGGRDLDILGDDQMRGDRDHDFRIAGLHILDGGLHRFGNILFGQPRDVAVGNIDEFSLIRVDDDPRELQMVTPQIDPDLFPGMRVKDIRHGENFFNVDDRLRHN